MLKRTNGSGKDATAMEGAADASRRGVSRRLFLKGAGAAAALGPSVGAGRALATGAPVAGEHLAFQHSVASGDPLPTGVIIWTRVTPIPAAVPGSGVGDPTRVRWEVAGDAAFGRIVAAGEVTSSSATDHTIKVDVTGLDPDTVYFYRFTVLDGATAGQVSRVGRTHTAPAAGQRRERVRFGVASCSNYESGHFRGYRDMADRDDLEFVVHLGDYTYEYAAGEYLGAFDTQVRVVQPANVTKSLADYRIRQGHYKMDPDLADLHAAKPMICIWDDHEFADNSWREGAGGDSVGFLEDFAQTKANATQAYYEWMPVRVQQGAEPGAHLYRTLRYGALLELILPDLRTYRDYQLISYSKNNFFQTDPDFLRAAGRADRSMLGGTQFEWFANQLRTSTSQWRIVGNSVMFAPLTLPTTLDPALHEWLVHQLGIPEQGLPLNVDQWDGFMVERQKIIDLLVEQGLGNTVFLTGDIHSSWANDIPARVFEYRTGANHQVAATEFVGCSISAPGAWDSLSSQPERAATTDAVIGAGEAIIKAVDPWFKYINLTLHGYMAVDVTPQRVQADWIYTSTVLNNGAPFFCGASYQALAGDPGARPAAGELDRSQRAY